MEIKCKICDSIFNVPKSRYERGNVAYCSKKCLSEFQTGKNHPKYIDNIYTFECIFCKKTVTKKSSIINSYCSSSCSTKHMNLLRTKEKTKKCKMCEKLIPDKNTYCSQKCMGQNFTLKYSGENNHNYLNGDYIGRSHKGRKERMKRAISVKTHTDKEWNMLLIKYDHKCINCGSKEKIEKDHIIPISREGHNGIDNIQPLCKKCNVKKFTKTIKYK